MKNIIDKIQKKNEETAEFLLTEKLTEREKNLLRGEIAFLIELKGLITEGKEEKEKSEIDALIDKAEQFLSFDDYDVLAEEIIALTKLEDTSASLDHTFGDDVCPIEKFEHCFTVGTFLEEIGYESN